MPQAADRFERCSLTLSWSSTIGVDRHGEQSIFLLWYWRLWHTASELDELGGAPEYLRHHDRCTRNDVHRHELTCEVVDIVIVHVIRGDLERQHCRRPIYFARIVVGRRTSDPDDDSARSIDCFRQ